MTPQELESWLVNEGDTGFTGAWYKAEMLSALEALLGATAEEIADKNRHLEPEINVLPRRHVLWSEVERQVRADPARGLELFSALTLLEFTGVED